MNATPFSSPRGEIAPAIVLVGDVLIRILEYAEHLDFLLSVRDEKLATLLQSYRDFGWWIIALASVAWLVYEIMQRRNNESARGSIGSLVACASFVSFLLGCTITVRATGSLPILFVDYGGANDAATQEQRCTAEIDVSRLRGFADGYRLILICGMVDPSTDWMEDTRIAVSSPFHIDASPTSPGIVGIVTPIGKLKDVLKTAGSPPPGAKPPFAFNFQMWHAVAIIPKDVQSESIKKASDIKQLGGRILTEGDFSSPMQIPLPTPQAPTQPNAGKS